MTHARATELLELINRRVQAGECHLAEVGRLLFGKFDQDDVAVLLEALHPSRERIVEVLRPFARWAAPFDTPLARSLKTPPTDDMVVEDCDFTLGQFRAARDLLLSLEGEQS